MYINFSHNEFANKLSISEAVTICRIFYANAKTLIYDFCGNCIPEFNLGFDRKIYLHIITEESGNFTKIPISRIY
jgi:hypothetical protein